MYLSVALVLVVLIIVFAIAKGPLKLNTELAMFIATVATALAGKIFLPFRHIAEGSIAYIDLILIFFSATIFMNIIKETGGLTYLVRGIMNSVGKVRPLALILLMIIMFIPGALTGAGSVTVLVVGAVVASALGSMGVSKDRQAAIIFILAGLSAVCPPVSTWAMMTCAGTAVPYVGFEIPLLIPCVVIGLFTVFLLGARRTAEPEELELSGIHPKMSALRVLIPFLVVAALIVIPRIYPYDFPTLGLPLTFIIAALAALICSPGKVNVIEISKSTVKQLLPLMTTMVVIGITLQILAATGVRGLLSWAVIAMPIGVIIATLPILIPLSEGIFGFGGAGILGIPLVWTFNSVGMHATTCIAGLSLLWFLGDALPPTAIIARMVNQTIGYKGSFGKFFLNCLGPWILTTAIGMALIIWSNESWNLFQKILGK